MYTIQRLKYWRLQFPCITLCMVLQISIFQQCSLYCNDGIATNVYVTTRYLASNGMAGGVWPKKHPNLFGNRVAISNNVTIVNSGVV